MIADEALLLLRSYEPTREEIEQWIESNTIVNWSNRPSARLPPKCLLSKVLVPELIFDDTHGHYELLEVGWEGPRRIHGILAHCDIVNGKIHVDHDRHGSWAGGYAAGGRRTARRHRAGFPYSGTAQTNSFCNHVEKHEWPISKKCRPAAKFHLHGSGNRVSERRREAYANIKREFAAAALHGGAAVQHPGGLFQWRAGPGCG